MKADQLFVFAIHLQNNITLDEIISQAFHDKTQFKILLHTKCGQYRYVGFCYISSLLTPIPNTLKRVLLVFSHSIIKLNLFAPKVFG